MGTVEGGPSIRPPGWGTSFVRLCSVLSVSDAVLREAADGWV